MCVGDRWWWGEVEDVVTEAETCLVVFGDREAMSSLVTGRPSTDGQELRVTVRPMYRNAVLGAALIVVFSSGCAGSEDDAVPESSEQPATIADTEVVAVPDQQASGCPPFDAVLFDAVETSLDDGLVLGLATSDSNTDGTIWLLASIYRTSDGERMSSVDTWASTSGEALAISGSAEEYSGLPSGGDALPDAFSDDVRASIEECATTAIRGG